MKRTALASFVFFVLAGCYAIPAGDYSARAERSEQVAHAVNQSIEAAAPIAGAIAPETIPFLPIAQGLVTLVAGGIAQYYRTKALRNQKVAETVIWGVEKAADPNVKTTIHQVATIEGTADIVHRAVKKVT